MSMVVNTPFLKTISASGVTYSDLLRPWSYWGSLSYSGGDPSLKIVNYGDYTLSFKYNIEGYRYPSVFTVREGKIVYPAESMIEAGPIVFPKRGDRPFIPALDIPLQTSKEALNAALLEAGFVLGVDFYFPL